MHDPLPLSLRQVWAVSAAAARELLWGQRAVSREIQAWRERARAIPDGPIREDALHSIECKRENADGAALFWILPRRRELTLLRLLVTYQVIWDFLDSVSERGACEGLSNGLQLHKALVEALDPAAPISDYYRYHPWRDDGGYLRALVEACRKHCASLPSYGRVKPILLREARRAHVQALNHDGDPGVRDEALRSWAAEEFSEERRLTWFELSSAATASLAVHAFLALAAQPACTDAEVRRTCDAYFPWVAAAATMLDSYVDQVEDAANGDHRYVAHYATDGHARERVSNLIRRSLAEIRRLPGGHRHAVITACMIAMYLSKDSARTPEMRESTASIALAGGSLTRALLPVLRLWRFTFARNAAARPQNAALQGLVRTEYSERHWFISAARASWSQRDDG
jgi:tetraprenyl-beta-curcumene synthase